MRFIGNREAKLDLKGRVFLPSVFRKELQKEGIETLVMRRDTFQRCLVLYPEDVWNELMCSMRKRLQRWNAREQNVYRQFVSEAEMVSLDGNGRFLLTKRLKEIAGIETSVNFIGMGDTIEIWAKESTEEPFMSQEEFGKALEELFSDEL